MQQKRVEVLGSQPFEASLRRLDNMLLGEVEIPAADAALALDLHLVPQPRMAGEHLAENFLRPAASVNIRVIKKGDPVFHSGQDELLRLIRRNIRHPHTAQRNGRNLQRAFPHRNLFHSTSLVRYKLYFLIA